MSKVTSTIKAVKTVFRATFRGYQTNQIRDANVAKKLVTIVAFKNVFISFIRHHLESNCSENLKHNRLQSWHIQFSFS